MAIGGKDVSPCGNVANQVLILAGGLRPLGAGVRISSAPHLGRFSAPGWFRMEWCPEPPGDDRLSRKEHEFMSTTSLMSVRADQALRQSPIPALRRLQVEESDHVIVLSGSVPSYYLKQLAQETLMPLLGSRELRNRVTVARS